jgi:hypothetical protein
VVYCRYIIVNTLQKGENKDYDDDNNNNNNNNNNNCKIAAVKLKEKKCENIPDPIAYSTYPSFGTNKVEWTCKLQ